MPSPRPSRRDLLRAGVAGAVAGLAGCTALAGDSAEPLPDATPGAEDWPMAGYDARNTRYNPDTAVARTDPEELWHREFDFCYPPVVRGDRVVLNAGDDDREYTVGLRASDGSEVWRSEREPWGYPRPALGAERAYVTGPDCAFGVALDDGAETWRGSPCHGANTAGGTVAEGRLYLAYGGYFSALDDRGEVTWASQHDVRGSPAVVGSTAYVATGFTVEAVDLGAAAREFPWEDRDDDEPPHAETDAATRWSEPTDASLLLADPLFSPAVRHGHVYGTFQDDDGPGGELRALDRDSGEERWAVASPPDYEPGEERDREDAPDPVADPVRPVVTDDLVVTNLGDRVVRAFTPGGESAWETTMVDSVTALAAGGDTLLALTHDRSAERPEPGHAAVVALNLATGESLWKRSYDDHLAGLTVAGGTVYTTVVVERDDQGDPRARRLVALG